MEVAKKETFAESALHLLKMAGTNPGPAATLTQYSPPRPGRKPKAGKTTRARKTPKSVVKTTKSVEYIEPVESNKNSNAHIRAKHSAKDPGQAPAPLEIKTPKNAPTPTHAHTPTHNAQRSKGGRPLVELPLEAIETICNALEEGNTVLQACNSLNIAVNTFFRNIDRKPEYWELYAHARQKQADALAGKVLMEAEACDGTTESFNRARIRIDAYKWACAKINPAKYSDKAQIAVTGADGGPVTIAASAVTMAEVQRLRSVLDNAIDAEVIDEAPAGKHALMEQAAEG